VSDLFGGNVQSLKLGAVALLTAQGIPMLHAGQEFNKNKKGNDNSYDQDNDINWIDWSLRQKNQDLYEFYRGLIALRKAYPNFRHTTALNNQHIEWLLPANQRALGYRLKGQTDFLVLLNSDSHEWISFGLPDGLPWKIVCNGHKVDVNGGLGTATGDYKVPPRTAVILKNR
jgi:pullulanase